MSPLVLWDESREEWVPLSAYSGTPAATPAGAYPIGSRSYEPPASNRIFISPAGSDAANGLTPSTPKKTRAAAMASITAGGTIVCMAGVYDDPMLTTSKPLTIQPYLNDVVWFDGSDVQTGWTAESGRWWAPITVKFSHTWGHSNPPSDSASRWVDAQNPVAYFVDMVFRDGVQLWQVQGTPASGQFMVDYTTDRVWIADNPSGREMRVAKRTKFLHAQHPVTVQGIGVRRYATEMWEFGALYLSSASAGSLVSNVHFDDIATQAIKSIGVDNIIEDVTIRRPGQTGIDGTRTDRTIIRRVCIREHNWRKFKTQPAAGGIKITFSGDVVIDGFWIDGAFNRAVSVWFDASNWGGDILDGYTYGGYGGVFIEASGNMFVGSVEMVGNANTYHGFLATIAKRLEIWNCSSYRTNGYHFANWQDSRYGQYERFADVAGYWTSENNAFYNLALGAKNLFGFYNRRDNRAGGSAWPYPYENMVDAFEGSVFSATPGQNPPVSVSRLAGFVDGSTQIDHTTITSFQTSRPFARGNAMTTDQEPTREAMRSYSNAVPIPSFAASKMGVATGLRIVGPPRPAPAPREDS